MLLLICPRMEQVVESQKSFHIKHFKYKNIWYPFVKMGFFYLKCKISCIVLMALVSHICCVVSSDEQDQETPRDINILSYFVATDDCPSPSDFPSSIPLEKVNIKKISSAINTQWIWKAIPETPIQLVLLTNWAYAYEYSVRPIDLSRSLTPLILPRDVNCTQTVLIDMTKSFDKMHMINKNMVQVETGARIIDLLEFIDKNNAGLSVVPIDGESTIGDSIAYGAYGTGVNSNTERPMPFASLSSLIMSFKAIVWDKEFSCYSLKIFNRNDPRTLGFLTHLGRAFLTEVTLLLESKYQLRCQTFTDFSSENLFSNPNSTSTLPEESFSFLVEEYGKVEVSYYPFVDRSFVKLWSKGSIRPLGSLNVDQPNSPFLASSVPKPIMGMASRITSYFPSFGPSVSRMMFDLGVLLMRLSGSNDVWGPAQSTMYLFSKDSTVKHEKKGYAVLTSRSNIQQVVHEFYQQFSLLVKQFRDNGQYPVNRPALIRISGLDTLVIDPKSSIAGGKPKINIFPPALSVLTQVKGHREFDTAVIFEIQYNRDTRGVFLDELESWIFNNYNKGEKSIVRPTWGTALSKTSHLNNSSVLKNSITPSFGPAWRQAITILEFYDPHKVFSNSYLNYLFSF